MSQQDRNNIGSLPTSVIVRMNSSRITIECASVCYRITLIVNLVVLRKVTAVAVDPLSNKRERSQAG
jgi:hypothetical protein